jgi:MFS family permease
MVMIAMSTAICQEETAPELRGRVMALFGVAFLGSTPIGAPIVGWVSEAAGPRVGLGIGAAAALLAGVGALMAYRHEDSKVTVDPGETALAADRVAAVT